MKAAYHIMCFLGLFMISIYAGSQTTKIRGKISDAGTKEPLPFVNIMFKNSTIGTITDLNGEFHLETRYPSDTLIISFLGYRTIKTPVQKQRYQELNLEMTPDNIVLNEIVVLPGENPAHKILRKIIKNKPANNPDKIQYYECETYNKLEIDINNFEESYKDKKIMKQFQFVFDYVDTNAVTGKAYLPVFLMESLSDYYYRKKPPKEKETIKASKISGVENESVVQVTGKMYQNYNLYDNYVDVFEKMFASPVADFGLRYYKYYLLDSMFINGKWCYLISFKPRRKQELTFTGHFWVHDTTFAIKKIEARIAGDANINYLNDMVIKQEFERIEDTTWFLIKDQVFFDFNLTDKMMGFFGKKTTTYRDIIINRPRDDDFYKGEVAYEVETLEDASEKDTAFWNDARHEKISQKEQGIYNMVDSVKEVPLFKTTLDIINTLALGYYVTKYWEWGRYYTFYSFNPIEGSRFKIGGRTSNEFSTTFMPEAHIAYGIKDERLKFGVGCHWMLSKDPRRAMYASYKYDMEQLGESVNAFREDNIMASVLSRELNDKLTLVEEYKWHYEHEWFHGLSNKLEIKHRKIFATEYIIFEETATGRIFDHLTSFEINFNTRFAYNEKFLMGEFERFSLGTRYPVINFNVTTGIKDVLHSDYEFYKLHINIEDWFNINPFGYMKYRIDAGQYFGNIPYPFLQLHEGNQTYALDDYAFNMMNYYEFVSDRYASLWAEHHFNGFFLNHIPLMRKLKWREVICGTILVGSVSESNTNNLKFPGTLSGLTDPYLEAGAGIENILKIFRVDAVWRLSYPDNPGAPKFGVRVKMKVIL